MPDPKTIFVTGPAGFIGSHFVNQFRVHCPRTTIVGMDDFSTGREDTLNPEIIFYRGSILNVKLLKKIFYKHKPEFVFHFAALPRVTYSVENPSHTSEVNIIGTVTLLEAARMHRVKKFIYSSSSAVYGNTKILPVKESKTKISPKSPYALQKYTGEEFCKLFSQLFGLNTISLRYFNVFGPGQYGDSPCSTVIAAWLESLYFPSRKKPFLEGDGKQSRDFCYVDDVVLANILAMKSKKRFRGEVLNIASGVQVTIREVKKMIEKYTGKKLNLVTRPRRIGDVKHTKADISVALKLIGYKPTVSLEKGLRETIQWFKSRKK